MIWYSVYEIGASSTFETNKETVANPDSSNVVLEHAEVDLWDSTDQGPVNGGTVTMNGTPITPVDYTADSGGYSYILDIAAGQTVPISFSGGPLVFSVSGSSKFVALTDTTTFPNRDMNVTAPGIGATVSKSSGFTINWSNNVGSSQTIVIRVSGDTTGAVQYITTDNGSLTVPSTDLSAFTTGGRCRVSVSRISYKYTTDTYGRTYVMAAWTTSTIYHYMVP